MKRKSPRILVVEDDRTTRKLIVRMLEIAGYEVVDTGAGKDALHIAWMCPPSAMVVDVMLPDMQGTDLVKEILEHQDCGNIKPVFLTGLLSKKEESRDYFFNINGKQFPALRKPINRDRLLREVGYAVNEAEKDASRSEENSQSLGIREPSSDERKAAQFAAAMERARAEQGEVDEEKDFTSPLW